MRRMLHSLAAILVLLTVLNLNDAYAQTSRVGGTLEVSVTDTTGAVIPNAEVRIRETSTNQSRALVTGENGAFRLPDLPPGTYEVSAAREGFAPYVHTGVVITLGSAVHLDIVLMPAGLSEQVSVTGQPPPLDPSQSSVTSTIDFERIEELPVRSRNYLDFVLLAPGVAPSNPQQNGAAQTQLADSGFTFGGLRPRSNNLSIDGVDNNDEFTGSNRTALSLEIIREFQVVNSGFSAESGGSSGGSINVVTRSGANTIHGDVFAFVQNGALNARNPLESELSKPSLDRYRSGSSLGGPIVKDRTFYYAAFEQEHTRGQRSSHIDPAAASVINRALSSGAFPGVTTRRLRSGFFPVALAETEAAGKINQQIGKLHSLMARYAFTNNREAAGAFNTGGLVDASARGSSFVRDQAVVGSLVSTLSSQTVSDLRFQIAGRRALLRTNDSIGPEIDIVGVALFGRPYEGNSRRTENHYEIGYTLEHTFRTNDFKVGGTLNAVRLRAFVPDGFAGVYAFKTLDDFAAGRPDLFRQAFGNPSTGLRTVMLGLFAQDHWTVSRQLTVDAGLRYDLEGLPQQFQQDRNNFSPRAGMAYSLSSRSVVRLGYGIFYDRYVLANLNRAIQKNGTSGFEQVAEGSLAAIIFEHSGGLPLLSPVAGIRPSIFVPDAGLKRSYSQQAALGTEYLLAKDMTVSANYLWVRGLKLSRTRNVNLLPPIQLTTGNAPGFGFLQPDPQKSGRPVFSDSRIDSRFDAVYSLEHSASSSYHGLSVSLNRRLSGEFELSGSYTLSKTLDDASDFDEQPQNPFELRNERAHSRQDQRHRFVVSALFDLPIGEEEESATAGKAKPAGPLEKIFAHIEMAPILTIGSGRWSNPLTGVDSNRSQAWPLSSRPLGFGRNTLKTPATALLDWRIVKYFPFGERRRLDFVTEFFNLLNRTNVTQLNPYFGTGLVPNPQFGKPVDALNRRQLQFSVDFEF